SPGDLFDVPVVLSGGGDLLAISVGLGWNPAVVEPIDVQIGDLIASQGGVMFSPGPGRADAALLGSAQGMLGQGAVASVLLHAVAAGAAPRAGAVVSGRAR